MNGVRAYGTGLSISAKGKDALSSNTEGEGERRELKQKC